MKQRAKPQARKPKQATKTSPPKKRERAGKVPTTERIKPAVPACWCCASPAEKRMMTRLLRAVMLGKLPQPTPRPTRQPSRQPPTRRPTRRPPIRPSPIRSKPSGETSHG